MPALDSADLAAISSRAQAWAEVFRLPLQRRVWRGQAGEFQGAGAGSSLDFHDHRAYAPGDDPRHINWQAYARTGHYSMKLYREETRPLVDVILDVSESMRFDPAKERRAAELFYLAIHAARKSGASLAASLVRGESHARLDEGQIHGHAWAGLAASLPPAPAAAAPDLRPLPLRARSLRLVVSDVLFDGPPEPFLRSLARNGGHGVILAPFLQAESDPGWEGNYEFIDAESGARQPRRVDPPMLRRYLAAYRRHFDLWKAQSRRHDVILARVPCEPALPAALQHEALREGALETAR